MRARLLAALLVACGCDPTPAPARPPKKLIEFGWDEPDPAFMRAQVARMETMPFDGCVFHAGRRGPRDASGDSLTWEAWGRRRFSESDLRQDLEDLRATPFRRFTHNFLRLNTTPADLDWFDDFAAVLGNARLAATLAHDGRCAGILLDVEQYQGKLFDYRRQRDAGHHAWEQYQAQARQRGREVIEALQAGFPGLTLLLTFGYSLPLAQCHALRKPLAECDYGLLAPFLDGLVDGAQAGTRLVDGHELSYGYRDPAEFESAYRLLRQNPPVVAADRRRYAETFSLGFGIWLDHDWRRYGWNVRQPAGNYFTPETFQRSVRRALELSDEYVWIYSETPRWWSPEPGPVDLPAEYVAALWRARQGLAPN